MEANLIMAGLVVLLAWAIPKGLGLMVVMTATLLGIGWLIYRWSERGVLQTELVKLLFGFCLLEVVSGLAVISMTLTEDAKNDAQISTILTMLGVLAGSFAQWAFSSGGKPPEGPK